MVDQCALLHSDIVGIGTIGIEVRAAPPSTSPPRPKSRHELPLDRWALRGLANRLTSNKHSHNNQSLM